jgi:hypothetical protein
MPHLGRKDQAASHGSSCLLPGQPLTMVPNSWDVRHYVLADQLVKLKR